MLQIIYRLSGYFQIVNLKCEVPLPSFIHSFNIMAMEQTTFIFLPKMANSSIFYVVLSYSGAKTKSF